MNSLHCVEENKDQPFPSLEIIQNKIYIYQKFTKKTCLWKCSKYKKIMAIISHFSKNTTLHILTLSEASDNLSFKIST
jgi:hypothetical protein